MTLRRPYTVIFSTMTLDGRLASSTGYSVLSCPYDFARLRLLRGAADAVMIGANTALLDDPSLRKRLEPRSEKYYRVVVDGRLRISASLRLVREPEPPVIVFTAVESQRARELEERGVRVHVVGSNGVVDLARALEILAVEYGVERLLVEGGGRLNYSLLSSRLVDEVRATITPYVFAAGRSFFEDPVGTGFRDTRESPRLQLVCTELCPCGRCVHVVYRVVDRRGEPLASSLVEPCLSSKLRELAAKGLV
ncbi:dihydrofolate reductase family protein [Hyperthermus butylicus]|uniref:Pyrimidine reductase, riboflavin biosynthesis, RibD n=1 Tax=Hyperthermus butylicus (strain DSM 5456 / JCM 9403 / PLM1-5) TaxID=415426 RepID=A2BKA6_HYPBU|nr:dihydrofolate reductase family protein [Hyperthermus butylicus]ABM80417.1 Pyrimidine reductase, riboflavin biosynthesis, RibD [Hyperthermus butylicus DSM 5456]